MDETKNKDLPIDVGLLCEAITDLNLSRRSVGLYPSDHPLTQQSLKRAHDRLLHLFTIRDEITLGIVKDAIAVNEYVLDKKNPAFREFAAALRSKGLAAVIFSAGLTVEELIGFHELISSKDTLTAQDLLRLSMEKGLTSIKLKPLDLSKIDFVEKGLREEGVQRDIWDDYVFALMEGRLADENDATGILLGIPPKEVAQAIRQGISAGRQGEPTNVIRVYITQMGRSKLRRELFLHFLEVIRNLEPELRQDVLQRALASPPAEVAQIEGALLELSGNDLEKALRLMCEGGAIVSKRLKGLIGKLEDIREQESLFPTIDENQKVIDDIALDASILEIFRKELSVSFVPSSYEEELEKIKYDVGRRVRTLPNEVRRQCGEEIIENSVAETLLELLESDSISRESGLAIITRLLKFVDSLLVTGRFLAISEIYNALNSHVLSGRFGGEVSGMIDRSFRSETFLSGFVESCKLWGRHDREGVFRLAGILRQSLIPPFLDALSSNSDAALRRFLLDVLIRLGTEVAPEAVKRLSDGRWFVVRNMIYIIRECGASRYADDIKPLVRHADRRVSTEALKTLIEFQAPDAFSCLTDFLQSEDEGMREQGVKLAGLSRDQRAVLPLIRLLDKPDFLGRRLDRKLPVIRALGEIGDPGALTALERLYSAKHLLARTQFEELQVEIFRTLKNYPFSAARPLIELGLSSRNREVRSLSEMLLKREAKHNAERTGG